MRDNNIDSLIFKIKENKEKYRSRTSDTTLIKESNLHKFDWCVLNLLDSLSFQKAQQYYEYAQSIGRAIKRSKCKDRLVTESFRQTYTYMLHRSNSKSKGDKMALLKYVSMDEINRIIELDQMTLGPNVIYPLEKVIKSLEKLPYIFTKINFYYEADTGESEANYLYFNFHCDWLSFNFRINNNVVIYNSYKFVRDKSYEFVAIATNDCWIESSCMYITTTEMAIAREIVDIFDQARALTEGIHMDVSDIKEEIEYSESQCDCDDNCDRISTEIAVTSKLLLSVIEDNNLPTPQIVYSQTTSFVFNWVRKNSDGKTLSLYFTVEGYKIHVLISTLEKIIKRKTVLLDVDKSWEEIKLDIERFYSREI